ncbi:hypothetical protein [Streptomyces sp. NPDC093225]|uniref:hypothetical protein n=1 Tax=Streptomyces sp. NPDC093225 TaxID=3366034 RepID=UPI0037F94552
MRKPIAGTLTGALAALGVLFAAPTAQADQFDSWNLYQMDACYKPWESGFKFHLWFNSGQNGTWRNVGYSVYDFDALWPGDGHAHPMRFCSIPLGSTYLAGSGKNVKNNGASGQNDHDSYWANVYYSSGYKGPKDVMAPYQHIDRFVNVYNDNASFKWS